jgi:hypothetical protein
VIGYRADRAGWSAMVETMVSRGAKATEDEMRIISGYLSTHLGK